MQKFILSVLLFLLLLTIPHAACNEVGTGEFGVIGTGTSEFTPTVDQSSSYYMSMVYFKDISSLHDIKRIQVAIDIDDWYGSAEPSQWYNVQFREDSSVGSIIGYGVFGYSRSSTVIYPTIYFDGPITGAGETILHMTTSSGNYVPEIIRTHRKSNTATENIASSIAVTDALFCAYASGCYHIFSSAALDIQTDTYYDVSFSNSYNWTYNASTERSRYNQIRDVGNKSKTIITINNTVFYNDTSFESDNVNYLHYTPDADQIWNINIENEYGDVKNFDIDFYTTGVTGTIDLSVTTYIKPDIVMADISLENADFINNNYYAVLQNSSGGWHSFGTWKPIDSYADMLVVWDSIYTGETLPMTIRGALYEYDLNTETYEMIAYSDSSTYVELPADLCGSLWTDKDSYNISEIVTVTYTSYADNIKIRAYQHGSITTYWYNDLPSGTDNTIKITFDEKDRGSWDLRLIENDVFTNHTSITITSGDTPYVKWYQSVYDQGQIAPYRIGGSGGLMLYSTDVDATLSIFDADSTEIYNFSVGSGNNILQINFAESAAPGMWTASLLNLGTRYNDTTMVTSTSPVIRFDSSVYETGDTIGINYFLPGANYEILLLDANGKQIAKFEPQSIGSYQTIPFSLTDNNEYGYDMIVAIDAGTYATGYWTVWVTDQYGTFVEDGTIWDRAKVSKSSGDSADTSNEMISIFFSPEGAFLLFTVCLTMMGLVLAKHPAGGGAGAVVGVGFGVYFKVLPPWLLFLMVVALVVLAGVSVAVYFKGR